MSNNNNSSSNNNYKQKLEKSLAELLGYDIGDVEDVIEHLLTFESKEDLLEHLSALLGREDDEDIISFVNNVVKYQNGEHLMLVEMDHSENDSIVMKREQEERQRQLEMEIQEKEKKEKDLIERMKMEQQKELDRIQKEKAERERMKQIKSKEKSMKGKKNNLKSATKITTQQQKLKKNSAKGGNRATTSSTKTEAARAKNTNPPDSIVLDESISNHASKKAEHGNDKKKKQSSSMPLKGKAKIICGCFGTVHKPLANCLHCGRIICTKEGYGYCPFCSYRVDEHVLPEGEAFDKAIMHKERLLEFDRQSASRTKVYDSQADYYSNSNSNWLSEKEQMDAEIKEEERKKQLHSRRHVLNLDL